MAKTPAKSDVSEINCALSRFGLGARPGDRKRIASDPRGAVVAELKTPDVLQLDADLMSGPDVYRSMTEKQVVRKFQRGTPLSAPQKGMIAQLKEEGRLPTEKGTDVKPKQANDAPAESGDMGADKMSGGDGMAPADPKAKAKAASGKYAVEHLAYIAEVKARFEKARSSDVGMAERLVHFWANHFAVSSVKGFFIHGLTGPFEREAIRPHVLGRFSDMLNAATRHPAMLWYLDNRVSVGPDSRLGEKKATGLNENHARELMELHTIGVDGGYTQADVTAFAKALTGWTTNERADTPALGHFLFDAARHEPGVQTIMGRRYDQKGELQAQGVLDDLARNPATAKHVARQLATSFVADDPPPALVERLAKTFQETDGDLMQVSLALAGDDDAWRAPQRKLRTPQDFAFASIRCFDKTPNVTQVMRGLDVLGQALWNPTSPQGYSLRGTDWLSPDAQTNRLDIAQEIAARNARGGDPDGLAEDILGEDLTDETRTAIKRAGSREQALALLLMSPEMQRR